MNAPSIIQDNILTIDHNYWQVKANVKDKLKEWPDLFSFDDSRR